jgi:hypothetical protein
MRKRVRKKAVAQAAQHGDEPPGQPHDVVRIFDRSGEVVFERDWGSSRPDAMDHEARIVEDLLRLDVLSFRAKYGIEAPAEDAGQTLERTPERTLEPQPPDTEDPPALGAS